MKGSEADAPDAEYFVRLVDQPKWRVRDSVQGRA